MFEYQTAFLPVASLEPALRDTLASLFLDYYEACDSARFQADLDGKDEILVLRRRGGELAGFSTAAYRRLVWREENLRIVFSGDTVIRPEDWGRMNFSLAWLKRMGRLWKAEPETPLYWFLISKGLRTYRYLPAYFRRFHPSWEGRDEYLAALADFLGRRYFGDCYDPARGVAVFPESRGQLKPELAEISGREAQKPAARFFLERNPGYRRGHELICLARLNPENLRSLGRRVFAGDSP